MLCPDGADLFIRRKLTLPGFSQRGIKVGGFFKRKFIGWLVYTRELQEDSREIVLSLIGQSGNGLDSLFEQAGHAANIVVQHLLGSLVAKLPAHGFPITIAIAAARNGNGSDTAARNHTNRAGMNGTSQRIIR